MYDHEIDTFFTVAEAGSFSAASRTLYISPSAVVQQINLLENKMDCELFKRDSHGVTLTEAGKLFLKQCRKIKRVYLETEEIMKKYQRTLVVGTGYLSTTNLLDKFWLDFLRANNVQLKFQEIKDYEKIPQNIDLIESLYSQEPIPKQGFLFKKVTTTPLLIAVPPQNKLAQKEKLTISDLDKQKILIINSSVLKQSGQIRHFIKSNCQKTHLISYSVFNKALVNEAIIKNYLILVHETLASSCSPLISKKVNWHFNADVGFFYRSDANMITKKLIAKI